MERPERRTALELVIAGGLTAVGMAVGSPTVWYGLASLAGSVGANWAADLAQAGYRHWCDRWFTEEGALNADVERALAAAFRAAVADLQRTWPHQPAYARLAQAEKDLTREGLEQLVRDGQALWEQGTVIVTAGSELLPLLQEQDASRLRRALRTALADYFHGYPEAFLDFVADRLPDLWMDHFERIVKGSDETGTRAWRALQRAWQGSLQAALTQIQADAAETRRMVAWLQDWAQRLENLPATARDDTGLAELLDRVPPTPARPRNLPGAASVFVGREAELAQILEALHPGPDRAHAVLIHGIRGMGGVGKTELALQAAWKLAQQYPDAQIFLECQVAGAAKTPEALLGELIRAFAPEERPPESLAEAQARVRALLGGKRGLVVLDNAADGDQVRPVLAAIPGGWAVMVTSRRRFGLPHGRTVDLNVLSREAAVALLRELLGGRGDEAQEVARSSGGGVAGRRLDEAMLARLAGLCGYLPLALTIAGAFLVNHPDWTLEEYLQALEQARLAHLQEAGVGDVAGVLGLSLAQLERAQPELARRWRLLAVMPAPFDRAMAAAVWAVDAATARDGLSELVRWSLVEYDRDSGLYNLHDLLRELAGPPDETVVRRHAEHVLREARAADDRFKEGGDAVLEALTRFEVLWPHLQAAWQRMHGAEDEEARRWLSRFAGWFPYLLDLRTTSAARIPYLEAAVAAARALGDRRGEGTHLGNLGNAYAALGRVEEAIGYYEQALAISREIGDRRNEGTWLANLGLAYAALGRMEEACDLWRQALAIFEEIKSPHAQTVRRWLAAHCGA